MALDVRSGDHHLLLDRTAAGVTASGEPLDVRTSPVGPHAVLVVANGRPTVATVERTGKTARVTIGGHTVDVALKTETDLLLERFGMDTADASAEREVRAPMPGLVLRVLAAPGEAVEAGQGLVVLEAMKMENELKAPAAGVVAAVHAAPGAAVSKGDLLVELAP
ncbi:MAG TPA: biotin/lipoyl-containing protein [Rubricoccaceae bacterium]|jgi:pyruvate carboxylase subunit B